MSDGLKFKPKSEQVRVVMGEAMHLTGMDHVQKHPDKLFMVIGPFSDFTDKPGLQDALIMVLRGYNLEER